jgi:hypothetical protein
VASEWPSQASCSHPRWAPRPGKPGLTTVGTPDSRAPRNAIDRETHSSGYTLGSRRPGRGRALRAPSPARLPFAPYVWDSKAGTGFEPAPKARAAEIGLPLGTDERCCALLFFRPDVWDSEGGRQGLRRLRQRPAARGRREGTVSARLGAPSRPFAPFRALKSGGLQGKSSKGRRNRPSFGHGRRLVCLLVLASPLGLRGGQGVRTRLRSSGGGQRPSAPIRALFVPSKSAC